MCTRSTVEARDVRSAPSRVASATQVVDVVRRRGEQRRLFDEHRAVGEVCLVEKRRRRAPVHEREDVGVTRNFGGHRLATQHETVCSLCPERTTRLCQERPGTRRIDHQSRGNHVVAGETHRARLDIVQHGLDLTDAHRHRGKKRRAQRVVVEHEIGALDAMLARADDPHRRPRTAHERVERSAEFAVRHIVTPGSVGCVPRRVGAITTVSTPRLTRLRASERPAGPAPMTTTSCIAQSRSTRARSTRCAWSL